MSRSGLSWSWRPADSRLVRLLLYIPHGLLGGLFVLMLVPLSLSLVQSLRAGEIRAVLIVVLVLAGWLIAQTILLGWSGRVSLRRDGLFSEFYRASRLRWHAVAALVGAAVQLLVFHFSPAVWAIGMLSTLGVSLSAAMVLSSAGELYPDGETLMYRDREIDLDSFADARRLSVGRRTFVWSSSSQSQEQAGGAPPRLLAVPTRLLTEIEETPER